MPELPEVETIRRDLSALILGVKISKIELLSKQAVANRPTVFANALVGQKFTVIERIGKLLIFKLSNGQYLLIHLKMTGQLIYRIKHRLVPGGHSLQKGSLTESIGGELPHRSTRVILIFANQGKLYFNDQRRFGYLKIVSAAELVKIKQGFGPEPLQLEFTTKYLSNLLTKRQVTIKAFLLDQKKVAGLGNIYVDESLFLAGICPNRRAGSLSVLEVTKLTRAIKRVISSAIKYRGTTFSDYRDATGQKGNFLTKLQVYGRKGELCRRCHSPIQKMKLIGRGTHFCPKCQK